MRSLIKAYLNAKNELDFGDGDEEAAERDYLTAFCNLIKAEPSDAEEAALKLRFAVENLEPETMETEILAEFLRSMTNFAWRY